MVGLADRRFSRPRQLSAGQQQRVVIARALINRPELLLADEPSSDLDEETEAEIMTLFGRIHAETGVTIVLVTHAKQLVAYGTRHIAMAEGAIAAAACPGGGAPAGRGRRAGRCPLGLACGEDCRPMIAYITINIDPIIGHLGPFAVRWYSLIMVLGSHRRRLHLRRSAAP